MDGINRTGGQDAAVHAAAKARMERLAQEAAKYTLPGVVVSGPPEPGQPPAEVPPMNLAQLRQWVEGHDGGIDVIA